MHTLVILGVLLAGLTKDLGPSQGHTPKVLSGYNNWYIVYAAHNGDDPASGPYSFCTYGAHPWGSNQMIITEHSGYGWAWPWFSYITVRRYELSKEFVLGDNYNDNHLHNVTPTSGWSKVYTYSLLTSEATFDVGTGVRMVWNIPGTGELTQELKAEDLGTFESSRIRITTKLYNTTGSNCQYGIRMLFDINIANNDSAYLWDGSVWRSNETAWDWPIPFIRYIVSKVPDFAADKFIYGNICDSSYGMQPTPPEHFSYGWWGDWTEPFGNGLWNPVWTDCAWQNRALGGSNDAAVAYWWGYSTPITLAPGQTFVANQYFFARTEPVGIETPDPLKYGAWVRAINNIGSRLVLEFNLKEPTIVALSLYDQGGRLMLTENRAIETGLQVFSLSEFPSGIYFLKVKAPQMQGLTFKAIKF